MMKIAYLIYSACYFSIVKSNDISTDPLFTNGIQQVWQGDDMLYEKLFGEASREYNIPVTRNTQFRIGSNSKTFTTIGIFQLEEQGHLSIHDDIALHLDSNDLTNWGYAGTTFCPKFNGSSTCEVITFYDLMAMRSGLVNALGCYKYQPGSWQTQYCVPESYFMFYTGSVGGNIAGFINVPVEDTPGTTYMYNNGNTIILSYFLEKYSGLNVAEYVRQKIFEPLGLQSTSQDALSQQLSANPNMAQEYYDYTDLTKSYEYFAYGNGAATEVQSGTQSGAGGFLSTAGDLVKFYSSLFASKNASSVISNSNLALMVEPISLAQYNDVYGCEYFGLGLFMVYSYPCTPSDLTTRMYIYYKGAISISTAAILSLDNWEGGVNALPTISVAIRNNAIVDATESSWKQAQLQKVGNLSSIFSDNHWIKYADSWLPALNNAEYFQATGTAYPSSASSVNCISDEGDDVGLNLSKGELAACVFVPTVFVLLILIGYIQCYVLPRIMGAASAANLKPSSETTTSPL